MRILQIIMSWLSGLVNKQVIQDKADDHAITVNKEATHRADIQENRAPPTQSELSSRLRDGSF